MKSEPKEVSHILSEHSTNLRRLVPSHPTSEQEHKHLKKHVILLDAFKLKNLTPQEVKDAKSTLLAIPSTQ